MNVASSRSHAVFTLELTEKSGDEDMDATAKALAGITKTRKNQVTKMTLIDLAGSERTNVSQTQGQSLKEGSAINKSLSVLGLVIQLLAKASKEDIAASLAADDGEQATGTDWHRIGRHDLARARALSLSFSLSLSFPVPDEDTVPAQF